MKVKMLTTACGPELTLDAGKFHDVEDSLALEFVKNGYAQRAIKVEGKWVGVPEAEKAEPAKAVAPEAETAESGLPEAETAEAPESKKKK